LGVNAVEKVSFVKLCRRCHVSRFGTCHLLKFGTCHVLNKRGPKVEDDPYFDTWHLSCNINVN